VLYGSTPLFLLLARAAGEAGRVARWLTYGAIGLLLSLYATLPWLAQAAAPGIGDPLYRELVGGASSLAPASVPFGALAAALAWGAAAYAIRGFAARAAIGAVAAALVLVTAVIPWVGDVLQGPVKRAAEVARLRPEPAVQWGVHVPSFAVYREQVTPRSDPAEGQLAVVRADRLQPPDRHEVLYRERAYALVRWHASAP
jgi:hypothetical protein